MEKSLPEMSVSLDGKGNSPVPEVTEIVEAKPEKEENNSKEDDKIEEIKIEELSDQLAEAVTDSHDDFEKVSEDIDRFLSSLSTEKDGNNNDKENVEVVKVEINMPGELVERFLDLVEGKILKQDSKEGKTKLSQVPEEDSSFLKAVDRISKLTKSLHGLRFEEPPNISLINRIGCIQQRAMSYLEEEFRWLLEESRSSESDPDTKGYPNKQELQDRSAVPESESSGAGDGDVDVDSFPEYSNDVVSTLNKIAKSMISGGYESECCQVYMVVRRNALEERLVKLGFEKHSIDDVQKMQWEALEREITAWINAFGQCATDYFSREKSLIEAVFSDYPSVSVSLFSNLTRGVLIQLLTFAEGIAMTKRSAEKLFKYLDMYETLRDFVPVMNGLFDNELKSETTLARCRLGEAAIFIFCDLENSIKADTGKTPVPGGAVHPLTRYTMNYLKYACEYKDTLEQVFKEHFKIERSDSTSRPHYEADTQSFNADNEGENQSPFSAELIRVMDLLDTNLEAKAKLYRDVALSNIFMMNNGRYILQKIKGSKEIHELMGDTWCRKRSSDLRQYHKNYQRETWNKLLGCLNHEGLNSHSKGSKPLLKERFKSFNQMFDEIHKTQSTWVVSDEQLQSELRVSISAVVIPAYRSFLGRFSQQLDPGRQTEKYVKYQPDDIETYIDELFDGNPAPTVRRKP